MIEVKHLFHELDILLIDLLKSLEPFDWEKSTSAKLWNVKDVASHLLDTNMRTLSIQRDGYFGEKPPKINGYDDLVTFRLSAIAPEGRLVPTGRIPPVTGTHTCTA